MRNYTEILTDIDNFEPSDGIWLNLDQLLIELQETEQIEKGITNLFKIFEKYPEEDGAGVFWTILHALENIENYKYELVESLNRIPSDITVAMVQRISNTGVRKIGNKKIVDIYLDIMNNSKSNAELLKEVKELIEEL